jgi:hypothetical protein
MSAGDFEGGCGYLQETRKEAADACMRLERSLWIHAGDKKGGCGCMYETWKEPLDIWRRQERRLWMHAGDYSSNSGRDIAKIAEEIIGTAEEI